MVRRLGRQAPAVRAPAPVRAPVLVRAPALVKATATPAAGSVVVAGAGKHGRRPLKGGLCTVTAEIDRRRGENSRPCQLLSVKVRPLAISLNFKKI